MQIKDYLKPHVQPFIVRLRLPACTSMRLEAGGCRMQDARNRPHVRSEAAILTLGLLEP